MQIALTKKLAEALKEKPEAFDESISPQFSWTANWTTIWSDKKTEELLILINNATRFTVAIYRVKKKELKNFDRIAVEGIRKTMLAMNLNPEMVEEYLRLSGSFVYAKNSNRQITSWMTQTGIDLSIPIADRYAHVPNFYSDTLGVLVNHNTFRKAGSSKDSNHVPLMDMVTELQKLTGMKAYDTRAFELQITLDLEIYQAKRRVLVPADISFETLHRVIQSAFGWQDYHLFEFEMKDEKSGKVIKRIVPREEDLEYHEEAEIMEGRILSEFMPRIKEIKYVYDFGDYWEHQITFLKEHEHYDGSLPFLLESEGKTPPEDVGGVGGFQDFLEAKKDPSHPRYEDLLHWNPYWSSELSDWEKRPRHLHIYNI